MTPQMLDALKDASAFNARGGLRYSVAGWEGRLYSYHTATSVSACVKRGWLLPEGKGKKRTMRLTESGRSMIKNSGPRKPVVRSSARSAGG